MDENKLTKELEEINKNVKNINYKLNQLELLDSIDMSGQAIIDQNNKLNISNDELLKNSKELINLNKEILNFNKDNKSLMNNNNVDNVTILTLIFGFIVGYGLIKSFFDGLRI